MDRFDPLREIRDLIKERRANGRPCLVFVHGLEGIGRAALVSEVFYDDTACFDGVYIPVDARQPDGTPEAQSEMLAQALVRLGVPEGELPVSDAARRAALQRKSAGRKFMMHVRDAVTADQVIGLIPSAAPEGVVVVTTRVMLRPLLEEGFDDILLGELPQAETRELLAGCLGATAGQIPVATLHELADACGGVPQAVRIVGAHLARRPHLVGRTLAELRAAEAAPPGERALQRLWTILDQVYDSLGQQMRSAYRMLAMLPGPSFGVDAAAVALGSGASTVGRMLDDLVDLNLLAFDELGRYSFYRLARQDARRRAFETDGAEECLSRLSRILGWYLSEAVPRDVALGKRWRVGPAFEEYAASNAQPPSRADALAWWRAEWRSVVECVMVAHRNGLHEIAWQTCIALFKYLHMHGHYDLWVQTHDRGVESAGAAGHVTGRMQVLNQRGAVRLALGELDAARADFNASYDLAVQARHVPGEQSALEWLGKVAAKAKHFPEAMAYYRRSRAVVERAGADLGDEQPERMVALLDLQCARALAALWAWDEASDAAASAEAYFGPSGELENHAKCLLVLGEAARGRGDVAGAVERFERAAGLFDADGARRSFANACRQLGDALDAAERKSEAVAAYRRAQEAFDEVADDAADEMKERLAEFGE